MAEVKASFDVTSVEGQMKVFNAMNGASISMKELENGQVIEGCTGVMQYEEEVDSYGGQQMSTVTVIFSADGTSYASISETVAKAGSKLIDFIKNTGIEDFNVKIVKAKSQAGRDFLNLQLVQ